MWKAISEDLEEVMSSATRGSMRLRQENWSEDGGMQREEYSRKARKQGQRARGKMVYEC
jgi:hypothetical protein